MSAGEAGRHEAGFLDLFRDVFLEVKEHMTDKKNLVSWLCVKTLPTQILRKTYANPTKLRPFENTYANPTQILR